LHYTASRSIVTRRLTNVTLDPAAVSEARELGINVSQACERGLVQEVRAEKTRRWQEENREAIDLHNAFIEKHGIPLAYYRQF